jgi:hypothetical protein
MSAWTRPLSPIERIWLTADRLCPPFVNQLVLEGAPGAVLREAAWRAAVAAAAAANPGCRLLLRGVLSGTRWEATGAPPPVRAVDGHGWDGRGPEGAPFLAEPLPPRGGPTCAVLLVAGDPPRVVVRTHHAVMDGRGTLSFVDDVFRALRGEVPVGAASRLEDGTLGRSLDAGVAERRAEDCLAPTGRAEGREPGVRWRRVTVAGRPSQLLPRLAVALARAARANAGADAAAGRVRFDVPVDLRPRRPGLRCTANLTGMLFVEVGPDDAPDDVARRLARGLAERREAAALPLLYGVPHVALGLLAHQARQGARRNHARARYAATAVLSNLGRLPLDRCEGAGFRARTGFFIPPGTDASPCFLAAAGTEDGVELVVSSPRVLATGQRLETLLATLAAELPPPAAAVTGGAGGA